MCPVGTGGSEGSSGPTVSCAIFWQAAQHPARAPFLISLFHPHKPRKSCKVRRTLASVPCLRTEQTLSWPSSPLRPFILVDHTTGSNQFPEALCGVLGCLLVRSWVSDPPTWKVTPSHPPSPLTQKRRSGVNWACVCVCVCVCVCARARAHHPAQGDAQERLWNCWTVWGMCLWTLLSLECGKHSSGPVRPLRWPLFVKGTTPTFPPCSQGLGPFLSEPFWGLTMAVSFTLCWGHRASLLSENWNVFLLHQRVLKLEVFFFFLPGFQGAD